MTGLAPLPNDAPLIINIRIPGIDSSRLESQLSTMTEGKALIVDPADPFSQVKGITLQACRAIGFISSPRPIGFHRQIGSPTPDRALPHEGLFTGRKIVHVCLLAEPTRRQKALQQQIASDAEHPFRREAGSMNAHDFIQFLHSKDPRQTDNPQCAYLTGDAAGTFLSAQTTMRSQQCITALNENWHEIPLRLNSVLDSSDNNRITLDENDKKSQTFVRKIVNAWTAINSEPADFSLEDLKLYRWVKSGQSGYAS